MWRSATLAAIVLAGFVALFSGLTLASRGDGGPSGGSFQPGDQNFTLVGFALMDLSPIGGGPSEIVDSFGTMDVQKGVPINRQQPIMIVDFNLSGFIGSALTPMKWGLDPVSESTGTLTAKNALTDFDAKVSLDLALSVRIGKFDHVLGERLKQTCQVVEWPPTVATFCAPVGQAGGTDHQDTALAGVTPPCQPGDPIAIPILDAQDPTNIIGHLCDFTLTLDPPPTPTEEATPMSTPTPTPMEGAQPTDTPTPTATPTSEPCTDPDPGGGELLFSGIGTTNHTADEQGGLCPGESDVWTFSTLGLGIEEFIGIRVTEKTGSVSVSILLPDGSAVALQPGEEFRDAQPGPPAAYEVTVTGTAEGLASYRLEVCRALSDPCVFNKNVTPTGPTLANGDVNKDGATNSIDATLVLQSVAGLFVLSNPGNADVNLDGEINSVDSALILQFEAGLLDSLPVLQ